LKIRRPCGTSATPRAAIISGDLPPTDSPKTTTSPRRGGSRPIVTFMQVDFPAPLRPSKPSMRASPSSNETSPSTWLSPYKASIWLRLSALVAKVHLPCTRVGDNLGPIAFDDDLAEMQQR